MVPYTFVMRVFVRISKDSRSKNGGRNLVLVIIVIQNLK